MGVHGEPEYRNEVVQFIVKNEDDPRAYFDRVCTELGFREESVDQLEEWFEDLTGRPPDSKEVVDIRMLAGEVAPNEDEIIRLIGDINEYDLMELGSWELITKFSRGREHLLARRHPAHPQPS